MEGRCATKTFAWNSLNVKMPSLVRLKHAQKKCSMAYAVLATLWFWLWHIKKSERETKFNELKYFQFGNVVWLLSQKRFTWTFLALSVLRFWRMIFGRSYGHPSFGERKDEIEYHYRIWATAAPTTGREEHFSHFWQHPFHRRETV